MPDLAIRQMTLDEFKHFFKLIKQDFARGEYPPYFVLNAQLKEGILEGLVLSDGEADMAYAVCAAGHDNGCVLISLLAVFKELRGQGIGSGFMAHLAKRYADKQAIIVEVEKPELSKTTKERETREKRIHFYEKAGYHVIPGVEYSIWDVPMHLMALPLKASEQMVNGNIDKIMYEIYLELMGKVFIHKMKLRSI